MKNIRYGYETDASFLGRAIRWFTKGRVNHVAIIYDSGDWENQWVMEAMPRGVVCRPDRNRKWSYVVTPKYDAVSDVRKAEEFVYQKYDFKGFFLWAFIILAWRWLKIKIRKPRMSGKDQMCSEVAARTLPATLWNEIKDPQWVHPEQLLQIQESHPELFMVEKIVRAK